MARIRFLGRGNFRVSIPLGFIRGYTLVEILITSSILAVVILTIYSAFHTGIFGQRNIEENIEVYQSARFILNRINQDLRNSFAYSDEEAKFEGEDNYINFLTLIDSYKGDNIVREYAFVSYRVDNNDKKLLRLCRKNKDALNNNSEIKSEEMAPDIEGMTFSYCDMEDGGSLGDWQNSWPNNDEQEKVLPACVKVTLTIHGRQYERTIFLLLTERS